MVGTSHDARLDRRLKRRSIFNRNFKHDNSANVRKRTVSDDPQKDYAVMRSDDYQMHLDDWIKYDDREDIGVPIVVDEPSFCENTDETYVDAEWNDHLNVDPNYMMFLKDLREVGNSYVLETSTGNGVLVVDYGREDVLFDRQPVYLEKSNNIRKRINAERKRISRSSSSERAEKTDKSYVNFLEFFDTSLKGHDNLVSDYDAGFCDSEVIMLDFDPSVSESHSPFMTSNSVVVAVDLDSGSLQNHCTSQSAQFRAGLLKDLKRPYNQAEYESLLEEVTCRKPHFGYRIFRGGIKSYKRDSLGKSYLDIYGDFADKIDKVQSDRHRVLNILRGFFYWLKNLAHEGAFPPWLDKCCMETLPLSNYKMAPHQISRFSS